MKSNQKYIDKARKNASRKEPTLQDLEQMSPSLRYYYRNRDQIFQQRNNAGIGLKYYYKNRERINKER